MSSTSLPIMVVWLPFIFPFKTALRKAENQKQALTAGASFLFFFSSHHVPKSRRKGSSRYGCAETGTLPKKTALRRTSEDEIHRPGSGRECEKVFFRSCEKQRPARLRRVTRGEAAWCDARGQRRQGGAARGGDTCAESWVRARARFPWRAPLSLSRVASL